MTGADLLTQLQETLGEAYRVDQELHGGGMSRLFRATEVSLGRQVVVKVLPPEMSGSVSARRFQREIELTAHLQHPHILPVLSAGAKDGILYYIMPFVSGESLRHRLTREGKLPVPDACRLLREIADALAFAHAEGVVHRDMKPENILLQGSHGVLADFGVAGALEAAQGRPTLDSPVMKTQLTGTGMSVGTPTYMAPEQLAADPAIDGRADIYALGVIGYEMLAGERPFAGLSGPQLLVARLTETPEPLHWVRPQVSEELGQVIARAMARDPEDRFQRASEMHDALDEASPRATSDRMSLPAAVAAAKPAKRRRLSRKRLARVGLVAGLAVLVAAAVYAWRLIASAANLEDNLIAVAPFEAYDPAIKQVWSEGVVDILSRNLDGMGPLRTVSPTTIVRQWPEGARPDPDAAVQLGRRTNAQYVLIGSILGEGTDSVRVTSNLVVTVTGNVLDGAEVQLTGPLNRMTALTDSITVAVLRGLGQSRTVASIRGSDLGTRSLPALKSFLRGEYFFRRAAWDSARTNYDRAVSQDSTFALAFHRIAKVNSWQRSGADSLTRVARLQAGRYNRGLSLRDSLLIAADSIVAVLGSVEGNSRYLAQARALFTTLRTAVDRYPNDPEVWYALGEAQHHYGHGPVVAVSMRRTLASFDRAISLDSTFAPAYIHAVELALALDGAERGLQYARKYADLHPTDAKGAGVGLAAVLAADPTSSAARAALDTASLEVLRDAWFIVRRWGDERETGVAVARTWMAKALALNDEVAAFPRGALVTQLAYRGRMIEAQELWGDAASRLYAELVMGGAVPNRTADAELRSWVVRDRAAAAFALPYLAERGDTATIGAYHRQAQLRQDERNEATGAQSGYDAQISGAYLLLAARDTASALSSFRQIPDTLCLGCMLDRLVEGRLLLAAGRSEEAAAILDERLPTLLSPTEVFFTIERAKALAALGDTEAMREPCVRGRALWLHADPTLRRALESVCGGG